MLKTWLNARALGEYKKGLVIHVKDHMQKAYQYTLAEDPGLHFDPSFQPQLTPAHMLKLGVFEGHYLNDCAGELPREWFINAASNLAVDAPDISKNCFQIKSRLSLNEWKKRGWITPFDPDVRGWFQWYYRYWLGRREPTLDAHQIKRWRAFTRHRAQIIKNCPPGRLNCRPRQRQALLQWAYNPFI